MLASVIPPLKRRSSADGKTLSKALGKKEAAPFTQTVHDEEFKQFEKDEPALAKTVQPYTRFRGSYSDLQRERLNADCSEYLPGVMRNDNFHLQVVEEEGYSPESLDPRVQSFFQNVLSEKPFKFAAGGTEDRTPVRVGVVLSGGQAPGGHSE